MWRVPLHQAVHPVARAARLCAVTSPAPRRLVVRPARRALAFGAGLAVAGLALSGCAATMPIQTHRPYSPSDGVRITLDDVRGSNLMLLSSGKGEPGVLHGAFTNDGPEDRTVSVTFGDDATPTTIRLQPRSTVLLDDSGEDGHQKVAVDETPVAPGAVLTLTVSTDAAGAQELAIPVLDGTLPDYASSVPTPSS